MHVGVLGAVDDRGEGAVDVAEDARRGWILDQRPDVLGELVGSGRGHRT